MKTLLISSGSPLPDTLRDVIERGSTSVEESRVRDLGAAASISDTFDRVVFWAPDGDATLRRAAGQIARAERRARREVIVYVTSENQPAVEGLGADETYVWPRDEDKLVMAFLTSA